MPILERFMPMSRQKKQVKEIEPIFAILQDTFLSELHAV